VYYLEILWFHSNLLLKIVANIGSGDM